MEKKEGSFVRYSSDGQLRSEGNYKNSKMDGAWIDYNKDGTVDKD